MKPIEPISGLSMVSAGPLTHRPLVVGLQIKRQSTTYNDGAFGVGRIADSKTARRGHGRVARGDVSVEDRRTAAGMDNCWSRAVAHGHDSRERYNRKGEGNDDGLEHCEPMVLYGMVDLNSLE